MDQFKEEEVLRMELGGNENCSKYFEENGLDLKLPAKLKYDNYVAADYKEKLSCMVEGRDFIAPDHSSESLPTSSSSDLSSGSIGRSQSQRVQQQQLQQQKQPTPVPASQKLANESYFATLGAKNDQRPADLPPSQGGKYAGFGNTPLPKSTSQGRSSLADFTMNSLQSDPLGTLSKGWGLFSSTVVKSVNEVNEQVIKPNIANLQDKDLTEEARRAMLQFGQKINDTKTYLQQQQSQQEENKFGALFNGLGEDSGTSVPNAFGMSRPSEKTKYQGLSGGNKWKDDEEDKWDNF